MAADYEKNSIPSNQDENVSDGSDVFDTLAAQETSHAIKYRTMSWQRTAVLLFGDQICLAIMAQPWAFSVLGWVPGLIASCLAAIIVWVTSYTMWQFIMKVRPAYRFDILGMRMLTGF
jgi:hypothetical protein